MLRLTTAFAAGGAAVVLARLAWAMPVRQRVRNHAPRPPRRLPPPVRAPLERALHDAGVSTTPEEAAWMGLATFGVAVSTTSAISVTLVPVVVVALAAAVPVGFAWARARGERAFGTALPAFVELVAARLRSGHTVTTALSEAGGRADPVAADARRVMRRVELGSTLADSLTRWADERGGDAVRAVAGALAVAAETGGAAAGALEGLARSLRDQLGARAEAAALSAQARLSALVVGGAPLAYLVFAAAVDPASVTTLVTSGPGRVCLALGLGLDVLGALWMRRIVRSEP